MLENVFLIVLGLTDFRKYVLCLYDHDMDDSLKTSSS